MSFLIPPMSESFTIFPHREIELSVFTTKALFDKSRDLLSER